MRPFFSRLEWLIRDSNVGLLPRKPAALEVYWSVEQHRERRVFSVKDRISAFHLHHQQEAVQNPSCGTPAGRQSSPIRTDKTIRRELGSRHADPTHRVTLLRWFQTSPELLTSRNQISAFKSHSVKFVWVSKRERSSAAGGLMSLSRRRHMKGVKGHMADDMRTTL